MCRPVVFETVTAEPGEPSRTPGNPAAVTALSVTETRWTPSTQRLIVVPTIWRRTR